MKIAGSIRDDEKNKRKESHFGGSLNKFIFNSSFGCDTM